MRALLAGVLVAVVVWLTPSMAEATDWQHESPIANANCYECHSLYVRSVDNVSNYTTGCLGCHNQGGHLYGTPWGDQDEAVPGVTGNNHNWSGPAVSAEHGANISLLPDAARKALVNGNLQCTVCHNPHVSAAASPESMHVQFPPGEARGKTGTYGTVGGTGTMTTTVASGSAAKGFRVRIRSVTATGGTFIISHVPGGRDGTWLNWVNSAWTYVGPTGAGYPFEFGVDAPLDVAGVSARWTTGVAEGDFWDFYVGYPFLRITNVNDGACVNCHAQRVMNHVRARGLDTNYPPNGVRKFSHPVGVGLNANGFNTDRSVILDVDGTSGSSTTDGDGGVQNKSNDLNLSSGNVVCTTCHAAHNADSNSLTVDVR